jgi:hypothetical protein
MGSAPRPIPNLDDQVSIFISPGDWVAQLYPQAPSTHFSRLLRHVLTYPQFMLFHFYLFNINLILPLHSTPSILIGLFPSSLPTNIMYIFLTSPCVLHVTPILIIYGPGYGLENRGSIPSRGRDFYFFVTASRETLGLIQPPIQWVSGVLSQTVKWPKRETDHSPPSIAVVKNV